MKKTSPVRCTRPTPIVSPSLNSNSEGLKDLRSMLLQSIFAFLKPIEFSISPTILLIGKLTYARPTEK